MSKLIVVASFPNLAEAELAQTALAEEGIESALDNGTVVQWSWQLANAVGGVKVAVDESVAEQAYRLLHPDPLRRPARAITVCPECGEPIEPTWVACWRCAGDGEVDRLPTEQETSPDDATARRVVIGVIAVGIGLAAFVGYGFIGLAVWLVFIVIMRMVVGGAAREATAVVDRNDEAGMELASWRTETCDHAAMRAWRSAMFGLCVFPPLAIHALCLALRLRPGRHPLSERGRWHRRGAMIVSILTIGLWMVLLSTLGIFSFETFLVDPLQQESL